MNVLIRFYIVITVVIFSLNLSGCGNTKKKPLPEHQKSKSIVNAPIKKAKKTTTTNNVTTNSSKQTLMSQETKFIPNTKNITPKQYKDTDELLKEKFEREHSQK